MPTPERHAAPWLDETNSTSLGRAIARRALLDIGVCEQPPGSNRSPRIDEYLKAAGTGVGQPWCAAALTAWWREAGADVPPKDAASCDAWMAWGKAHGLWTMSPSPGCAAVYGKPTDASHIECVVRVLPRPLTVGGNVGMGDFTREGWLVDLRPIATERLLGFIRPRARCAP